MTDNADQPCPVTGLVHNWTWQQTGAFDWVLGGPEEEQRCLDCGIKIEYDED